jgi:hypothetical protein
LDAAAKAQAHRAELLQEPLDNTKGLSIRGVNEFHPRRDDAARLVDDGARLAAA